MNEMEFLETIETMLKKEQFDCSLEPDVKAPPFGRVLVFLGNDTLEREKILEITAQNQDLGESLKEPPSPPAYTRIQFEVPLPFDIKEHTANEVASLLAFLNRMLELPGFELDEVNSKIYYRYVHLTPHKGIDKTLITGIVGVIIMLLGMFSDTIEQVSEGKRSFNDLLEQMLQLAETMGE